MQSHSIIPPTPQHRIGSNGTSHCASASRDSARKSGSDACPSVHYHLCSPPTVSCLVAPPINRPAHHAETLHTARIRTRHPPLLRDIKTEQPRRIWCLCPVHRSIHPLLLARLPSYTRRDKAGRTAIWTADRQLLPEYRLPEEQREPSRPKPQRSCTTRIAAWVRLAQCPALVSQSSSNRCAPSSRPRLAGRTSTNMNVSIPSDRPGVAGWWSGGVHTRAQD
jgi:hypothetical protein